MKKYIVLIICLVLIVFVSMILINNKKDIDKSKYENILNMDYNEVSNAILDNSSSNNKNLENEKIEIKEEENIESEYSENTKIEKSKVNNKTTTNDKKEDTTEIKNTPEKRVISDTKENEMTKIQTEQKSIENKETKVKEETIENKVQEEKKVTEEKVIESPTCTETKHYVAVGNSNRWFDSYDSAVNYYNNLINGYSEKVKSGEISYEEYCSKCPYGYEIWSCPKCNKWTLNYYYR